MAGRRSSPLSLGKLARKLPDPRRELVAECLVGRRGRCPGLGSVHGAVDRDAKIGLDSVESAWRTSFEVLGGDGACEQRPEARTGNGLRVATG